MNRYKISIIVPVYNVDKYLSVCIDSLLHQDLPSEEYEIILVNDGSTDNSSCIAIDYATRHPNVRYHTQVNQGQAVARNLGLDVACGDYIMFVDSDDYVRENFLKRMYDVAFENDNDILIAGMEILDQNNCSSLSIDFKLFDTDFTGISALQKGLNIGSSCSRLYRRNFIQINNLRFKSGIKHEDVYFNLEAYSLAQSIRSVDIYPYVYRWHVGSTDRSFDRENLINSLLSDLEIAKYEKELALRFKSQHPDFSLYLDRYSNSLLISNIISFYFNRNIFTSADFLKFLKQAKIMGLYPIKGFTNSFRTTILIPLVNCLYCYFTYCK